MNIYDIILIIMTASALVFALRSVVRSHKNGSCSCGCSGCPHAGSCHRK